MAKRMLFDILVKVLGEFVELNESNLDLSLAVWSGQILLHDLKLKSHKLLRSFDISILNGEVKTLEVTIPWTALLNSPVKLVIDGVNLQVGPLNVAARDKEETRKRVMDSKLQKLKMVDKFLDFSNAAAHSAELGGAAEDKTKQKGGRATYMQQWTAKIVDNIEITIRNVHIRYEDSQSIPGCIFSTGVTLNSFTLSTCDEKWQERFIARDINKGSSIRKMAKLQNFGIYWKTRSQALGGLSFKEWSAAMQTLIYRSGAPASDEIVQGSSSGLDDSQYILSPTNNLVIKLIHNERPVENAPKFDMLVESTALPISIDRAQYLQFLRTMQVIGSIERQRQPYMYRPESRPTMTAEAARLWWRYGCKLVIKRKRYIELVKLSKTVDSETGKVDVRTDAEKLETAELEERISLRTLVIFRYMAAKEMQEEYLFSQEGGGDGYDEDGEEGGGEHSTWREQHDLSAANKKKTASRTWWSWFGGTGDSTTIPTESVDTTRGGVDTESSAGEREGLVTEDGGGGGGGSSSPRSWSESHIDVSESLLSGELSADSSGGGISSPTASTAGASDHQQRLPGTDECSPRGSEQSTSNPSQRTTKDSDQLIATAASAASVSSSSGKPQRASKNASGKMRSRSSVALDASASAAAAVASGMGVDVSIASIISTLEKDSSQDSNNNNNGNSPSSSSSAESLNAVFFRLSLATSATLDISVGSSPVANATMALKVLAEVNVSGVVATIDMTNLLVVDKCTERPAIRNVICVKGGDSIKEKDAGMAQSEADHRPQQMAASSSGAMPIAAISDQDQSTSKKSSSSSSPSSSSLSSSSSRAEFRVIYENLGGKSVVRLSALPLEFVVNKSCVQQLIGLFLVPPVPQASATSNSKKQQQQQRSRPRGHSRVSTTDRRRRGSSPSPGLSEDFSQGRKHLPHGQEGVVSREGSIAAASGDGDDDNDHESSPFRIVPDVHPLEEPTSSSGGKVSDGSAEDDTNDNAPSSEAGEATSLNSPGKGFTSSLGMDIIFEAHAPKIIVPENSTPSSGFLLLDTGYLEVKGSMGPAGMKWDVSLRDVNAGMPKAVQDMYAFGQQSLYLIKPFHIVVEAQTIDQTRADMTVNVNIIPEMRGELDAQKLARLLTTLQVLSQTFSRGNCLNAVAHGHEAAYPSSPYLDANINITATGAGAGTGDGLSVSSSKSGVVGGGSAASPYSSSSRRQEPLWTSPSSSAPTTVRPSSTGLSNRAAAAAPISAGADAAASTAPAGLSIDELDDDDDGDNAEAQTVDVKRTVSSEVFDDDAEFGTPPQSPIRPTDVTAATTAATATATGAAAADVAAGDDVDIEEDRSIVRSDTSAADKNVSRQAPVVTDSTAAGIAASRSKSLISEDSRKNMSSEGLLRIVDSVNTIPSNQSPRATARDDDDDDDDDGGIDATHVSMEVLVNFPMVALDLLYDVEKGHHIILAVHSLAVKVLMHPYDMEIFVDLNELSIQDTMRSASQRDLARTPKEKESQNLVHLYYASINNSLSPLYRNRATEVVVNFANLDLDFDTNTLAHLRPFIAVLLAKKAPPPPPEYVPPIPPLPQVNYSRPASATQFATSNVAATATTTTTQHSNYTSTYSSGLSLATSNAGFEAAPPRGMHIVITVENIALDLLRAADGSVVVGLGLGGTDMGTVADLAHSFALQMTDLRADIDMYDLMKADVKMRSFEIIDEREVSKDYVFRKLFCPVLDMDASVATWRSSVRKKSSEQQQQQQGDLSRTSSTDFLRSAEAAAATADTDTTGAAITGTTIGAIVEPSSSSASSVQPQSPRASKSLSSNRSGGSTSMLASYTGGVSSSSRSQSYATLPTGTAGLRTPRKPASSFAAQRKIHEDVKPLPDLLHVTYNQESKTSSFVNVVLMNTTSFVSIDTILDFANVAMANAFAVLDLLASPPPIVESAPTSPINPPASISVDPAAAASTSVSPKQLHKDSAEELRVAQDHLGTPTSTTSRTRQSPSSSTGTDYPIATFTPPLGPSPLFADRYSSAASNDAAAALGTAASSSSAMTQGAMLPSPGIRTSNDSLDETPKKPLIKTAGDRMVISSSSGDLIVSTSKGIEAAAKAVAQGGESSQPSYAATANTHTPLVRTPSGSMCISRSSSHQTAEPPPNYATNTMNVSVKVTNPRLILLDDPATDESRAIVSSCGIEVHYTRETKVWHVEKVDPLTGRKELVPFASLPADELSSIVPDRELCESLHVSIHENRVSVVRSMLLWSPQSILEPMGLEFNLRRRSFNGRAIESNLSLDMDSVNARVSINDILLAQSIMTRRSLSEPPPQTSVSAASQPVKVLPNQSNAIPSSGVTTDIATVTAIADVEAEEIRQPPSPLFTFSVNLGTLSLVGINDFNGQNVPVIRAMLDGTTFYAEGQTEKVQGDGSLIASADFYNPRLAVWEPIFDRWHPSLSITKWSQGMVCDIRAEHTLQLTVSGIMLEKLLQTYSLFLNVDEDGTEREIVPDVVLKNSLGDGIDIEVFDSVSGSLLMKVAGGECVPVPKIGDNAAFRPVGSSPLAQVPQSVDIWFSGSFGDERMPIYHLPFNVNKPKTYNLQPRSLSEENDYPVSASTSSASAVAAVTTAATGTSPSGAPALRSSLSSGSSVIGTPAKRPQVILEPIIEETYENARYDPITGRWRAPYLPGDSHEWTDASGTRKREIQSIQLRSDRWEWLGKWEIDRDGAIGVEIDEEGWEYSTTFANFSIASRRRASQPMDCVRRRRWTRTRVPTAAGLDERFRPLTVFWDVQALQNGCRKVDLRSGLQVHNQMPFAIAIALRHSSWSEDVELGPINEGDTFNVPLLQCCAVWVRARPFDFPYEWSNYIPSNLQAYDFEMSRDIVCEGQEITPICAKVLLRQKEKSLKITIQPYLVITNALPCDMQYVIATSDRKREEGSLISGSNCKLANINLAWQPRLSIRVGPFLWTAPRPINVNSPEPVLMDIVNETGVHVAVLCFVVQPGTTGMVNIEVFSRGMIVDRTSGLDISIWSRRRLTHNSGVDIVRSTFSRNPEDLQSGQIVRPALTPAENKRRRAAIRAAAKAAARSPSARNQTQSQAQTTRAIRPNSSWSVVDDASAASAAAAAAAAAAGASAGRDAVPSQLTSLRIAGQPAATLHSSKSIESLSDALESSSMDAEELSELLEAAKDIIAPLGYGVLDVPGDDNQEGGDDDDDSEGEDDDLSGEDIDISDDETVGGKPHTHIPLSITDFHVGSRRHYELTKGDIGDLVYTDRNIRWTHLPLPLRKHFTVRSPNDDKISQAKKLIQFKANKPCMVLVLIDVRTSVLPKWIAEDGYRKIVDQAIARSVTMGVVHDYHYAIYGKYFLADEAITLRGNWSKTVFGMYSVFVLPAPTRDHYRQHEDNDGGAFQKAGVSTRGDVAVVQPDQSHVGESMLQRAKRDLRRIYDEVVYDYTYRRSDASKSWIEGGNGLSVFHSDDDNIAIGIKRGTIWTEELSINTTKTSLAGSFEAIDWDTMKGYQLSYKIQQMPGLFGHTQLMTIMPRYCIVNCLDEPILIVQRGSREILEIAPYHSEPWHKSNASLGCAVQLRCPSSLWSMGSVDLNEIGSSVLHLPRRNDNDNDLDNRTAGTVIHVEVKMAEPSENCSVVAVIWQAGPDTQSAYSIRNDSNVHITVKQADIDFAGMGVDPDLGLFEVAVAPNTIVPFGWADPDAGTDVLVTVGTSMKGPRVRIAKINFLKAGEQLRLPDNSGRGEVVLSVVAEGGGRVLRVWRPDAGYDPYATTASPAGAPVSTKGDEEHVQPQSFSSSSSSSSFGVSFSLASLGISLVLEKPIRREFFSLYVDGLEGRWKTKGTMRSLEFMISDLQVDNYSETAIYPVLLHSTKKEVHRVEFDDHRPSMKGPGSTPVGSARQSFVEHPDGQQRSERSTEDTESLTSSVSAAGPPVEAEVPLFQMTLVEETPRGTTTSVLKYVAVRVLPIAIEVDSATMTLLVTDLLTELKFVNRAQAVATNLPDSWIDEFNVQMLSPEQQYQQVDVYRSQLTAQASKIYIEKLILHPMKITFTFVQTPYPRKIKRESSLQSTAVNVLTSLAAVDRMQIRLKSFEVEDALESRSSLINHITLKVFQDLQSQLAQIAGSLSVIGSPMGFARKVGTGVKSFFYEPYQGAVHSPHDFVVGLGRGTSALFANFVTGAMNSTVAFVGTASKGIGFLSGDADYIRRRAIKRQRNRANRGGVVQGLMNGSESLISGITSGMSGLVTKPLEEARKSGVKGFFRGIGLGLVGAAVKPMMGFTDGVASVATGISNAVGETSVYVHVRPARALERSSADADDLVIMPLNLEAAFAQDFVIRRAKANSYEDAYLSYIPMEAPGEAMILSETYVYWRKPKSLWGRTWANISHCFFLEDCVGVMLYGGDVDAVIIECGSKPCAVRVYTALAQNATRMGNPALVVPVDLVTQDSPLSNATRERLVSKNGRAASLTGELDGYRFGSANTTKMIRITGPENDVLLRAEAIIGKGHSSWKMLDEAVWRLIWEWDCTHVGMNASRCCAAIIINRSDSPIQISRVQMVHGKNVMIIGSANTGYEVESRALMPEGVVAIFIWAFTPSPIEVGHLKANINTAAFSATVASTQRESVCDAKGGFTVGFLEKSVTEWWSKYVLLVT